MLANVQVWFIQKRAAGEDLATTSLSSGLRLSADVYQAAVREGVAIASDVILQRPAAKVRVLLRDESSGKIGSVDVPVDSYLTQPAR